MQWLSAISENPSALHALEECLRQIREIQLAPPDIAFLFPSTHHAQAYRKLSGNLKAMLKPKTILGCSAGGVIAGGQEVEHKPALGLTCAWLPEVRIHTFHLDQDGMPNPDAPPKAWKEWLGLNAQSNPSLVLLCDPFSIDPEQMVRGLDFAFPKSIKIGGLASGASQPKGNALYLDVEALSSGAVGAAFEGNITIDPIVAQGCRPIGEPLKVTRCERNILVELDGHPALSLLQELFQSLPQADRELARTSLFLGLLNDPLKLPSKKDFLIRNLIGIDPQAGTLALGAYLRPGQIVQFHLRDAKASAQDLQDCLSRYLGNKPETRPQGALLFSCLGRGQHLYSKPNHDTELFLGALGPLALGGFFCNGEIGPVEGATYLHGFTSCFGVFRPAA